MNDACSTFDLLLMVYADGEATPDEQAAVKEHVGRCSSCRLRLVEWQGLNRQTSTLLGGRGDVSVASASLPPAATASAEQDVVPTRHPRSPAATPGAAGDSPSHRPSSAGSPRTTAVLGLIICLLAILSMPFALSRQEHLAAPAAVNVQGRPASEASAMIATVTPTAQADSKPVAAAAVPPSKPMAARGLPAATPEAADTVRLKGSIAAVVDGSLHLYTATDTLQLTAPGTATAPRWSPSGRWLLYDAIGTGRSGASTVLRLLHPGTAAPPSRLPPPADAGLARWSPRRDEIAVAAHGGSLWLVAAESDQARSLLPDGGEVTNLSWSPDGAQLAVERRGVGAAPQSLWLVSRSGAIREAPLSAAASTSPGAARGTPPSMPAGWPGAVPVLGGWAPGNAGFTYWRSDTVGAGASTAAPLALWTAYGSLPLLPAVPMYRDFVTWAPDGHALAAVASVRAPGSALLLGQITVVPVAPPGPAHELTDAGRADGDAAWSPDGSLIAYASSEVPQPGSRVARPRRIWVEAPDGSNRRPLSSGPQDSFPQWSKDGEEILYVHQAGDAAQLWIVARDGSDPHPVVSGIVGLQQLPYQQFGNSGLVSYRGVFDWSDAARGD